MSAADLNNLFGLSGKTALVTGGTRGIGMMMARGLLQAGARVIVSSRKADACEQAGVIMATYVHSEIPAERPLPWSHIRSPRGERMWPHGSGRTVGISLWTNVARSTPHSAMAAVHLA